MFRLNLLNNRKFAINRKHIQTIQTYFTNKTGNVNVVVDRSNKYLKSTFERIVINKLSANNNEIYQNDSKKFDKLTKYTTKVVFFVKA